MRKRVIIFIFLLVLFSHGSNLLAVAEIIGKKDIALEDNQELKSGIVLENNFVTFQVAGLPSGKWRLKGTATDFQHIGTTTQPKMKENKYEVTYQLNGQSSKLFITQRVLPNQDQVVFVSASSPTIDQQLKIEFTQSDKVYGSEAYHYIDKGAIHTLLSSETFKENHWLELKKGESLDQWVVFSSESLKLDGLAKKAWEKSLSFHQTNTWITPIGAHRYTPLEYQNKKEYHNKNINLQASSPTLLIEALPYTKSRLIEDFVHQAKFTLAVIQGKDGFWRTTLNAAYLDRAYGLGDNFIDTRMSADASLFLLKYGLFFEDNEAIDRAKQFKQYFKLIEQRNIVYRYGDGMLYPDYYSEKQRGKTLVSLNHALHEINYLYNLSILFEDNEAKKIADKMLLYMKKDVKDWIKENNDLHYALSPQEKYYGKDYTEVTYVDLFTLKGLLIYMNEDTKEIDALLKSKGKYLQTLGTDMFETNLRLDRVFHDFIDADTRRGDFWLSLPLDISWSTRVPTSILSYANFYWLKGAKMIKLFDKQISLNPKNNYMVIVTKDRLYLFDRAVKDVNWNNGLKVEPLNEEIKIQVWGKEGKYTDWIVNQVP